MIEQNGFQILVWREILHKISHFVANFRFGPPPTWYVVIFYLYKLICSNILLIYVGGGPKVPFWPNFATKWFILWRISRRTRIWNPFCSILNIKPATGHFVFFAFFIHFYRFFMFGIFKICCNFLYGVS